MLDILHVVHKWHQYRLGMHFKLKTNHSSLKYFLEQQDYFEEQQRWTVKTQGYDFEVVY